MEERNGCMRKREKRRHGIALPVILLAVLACGILLGIYFIDLFMNQNSPSPWSVVKTDFFSGEEYIPEYTRVIQDFGAGTLQQMVRRGEERMNTEQNDERVKFLTGQEEGVLSEQAQEIVNRMTLEEKAAQLFILTPEALTGQDVVTSAGDITKDAVGQFPAGGLIYQEQSLLNPQQVSEMTENTQQYSLERIGLPMFLSVDEEGGTVTRFGNQPAFSLGNVGDMCVIGATGDPQNAYNIGTTLGGFLHGLGINMDNAPVADVLTNPENTVVQYRSFGGDCNLVAEMAIAEWRGLKEQNVIGVMKHFPGHGGTAGDTHNGYAYTEASLDEMKNRDLVPFARGIQEGVDVIMAAHISCPNVTGDQMPASLSYQIITELLRGELGFQGIVVTDSLAMGAVADSYSSAEASVLALQAGCDMLLMPADFRGAYQGILEAVQNGALTEQRLNESVKRIVMVKLKYL